MKILVIDNYDSFTYNLVHILEKYEPAIITVRKNNSIKISEIDGFDRIVLSPGPGLPKDAGITTEVIKHYHQKKPILGVCLGLQAIGEVFNSKLKNLDTVMHGIKTPIKILENDSLFNGCPREFEVGRYHSWVIDNKHLSNELQITAVDHNNEIMALKHKTYNVKGVQFHPESILSEYGELILLNWLKN
jgi:anthranilate synthase component II